MIILIESGRTEGRPGCRLPLFAAGVWNRLASLWLPRCFCQCLAYCQVEKRNLVIFRCQHIGSCPCCTGTLPYSNPCHLLFENSGRGSYASCSLRVTTAADWNWTNLMNLQAVHLLFGDLKVMVRFFLSFFWIFHYLLSLKCLAISICSQLSENVAKKLKQIVLRKKFMF